MTIINDYREEVKRFEHFFETKKEVEEVLPQLNTEEPQNTDMVNAAANSLRSPLLALKIYLDLLRNFPEEEKKSDVINRMKNTTNEMAKKINALARLVDVQTDFNQTSQLINFKELLEEVTVELSYLFDLSNITFTTKLEEKNFMGNASELSLMFFHLIHNCITYCKEDIPLNIIIKTKKVGGYTLIGVKDNGVGMQIKSDADAEKLFRPFYRLANSTGTGIGLSIVRSIVDKYNGEIKVKSREGEGSMFNIYLKEI